MVLGLTAKKGLKRGAADFLVVDCRKGKGFLDGLAAKSDLVVVFG